MARNFFHTGRSGENHPPKLGSIKGSIGPMSGRMARDYTGKPGSGMYASGARRDQRRPGRGRPK